MANDVLERILVRAKELGLSPRGASVASGLGDSAIRDLIRRPGSSPTMPTLKKLAVGLQTTPEWLAYGSDLAPADEPPSAKPKQPERRTASDPFVLAKFGGIVEAGAFREVAEFETPDREPDLVPRDERYPRSAYFVFQVAGDSMNAADPPIPPGSRVIAVKFDNHLTLQTGDIVIVQRKREQGGLVERSIKELVLDEHETRFCPRSTNSRHHPIVIAKNFDPDDTTEVEVLGLVIDVMMKVRRKL